MAFLDNTGLGTLWGRIKTVFGVSLDKASDSASVTIKLNNGYNTQISSTAIGLADSTNSKAGLMSPTEKSKLAGIAEGANAYTHPSYTANTAAAVKVGNDATGHVVIGAALTAGDVGAASSTHMHGNIMNNGAMLGTSASQATIAEGDSIVIVDSSNNNYISRTSITFDGSTTTKALTQKGTWETFNNYTHPSATATAAAAVKVGNDALGHVVLGAALTASDVGAAASSHTHGWITNDGKMSSSTSADQIIASGDQLLIADHSNSDTIVKTKGLSFDGSTTTKALTQKGTWETFVQDANYVHTDNNYTTADQTKVGYVDTGMAVTTYVSNQISTAMTGSAKYKGTVDADHPLPTTGYKQGDYYVVGTAGTYAGQTCEAGDMIFCNKDYASGTASNSDWDIVQSNITAMTTAEINAICV